MLSSIQTEKIRAAFTAGKLRVQSVSPVGTVEWKRVLNTHRAEVGPESIVEVTTDKGPMVLTGGHRVFLDPVMKTEAEHLKPGLEVQGIEDNKPAQRKVTATRRLPSRRYMYDLTAEDWHNFMLERSGAIVSNSPDRNYHFRPPTSQDAMNHQTRVFGYIWEDEELAEAIERGLDMTNLYPPQTGWTLGTLPNNWRTLVLTGAAIHALRALSLNWIVEEFSVGGEEEVDLLLPDGTEVSLTLEELYEVIKG